MIRRQFLVLPWMGLPACGGNSATEGRAAEAAERVSARLESAHQARDLRLGDPVFLRAFKEESSLEAWTLHRASGKFRLLKAWPIAGWSGALGPKFKEGDGQTPEGCYHTDRKSLNPKSKFHLSFNINYPNAFEKSRTVPEVGVKDGQYVVEPQGDAPGRRLIDDG